MKRIHLGLLLAGTLIISAATQAAEWTAKETEAAAPEGVSESIAALLQSKAVQVSDSAGLVWEFWFVKEAPLKEKPETPADAIKAVPEAAILGVVKVHESQRDYRDDEVYEDTYTMRYLLQPQDGNHLGTSTYFYYVALTPVATDQAPDQLADYDAVVEASSEDTATAHPIILSLRPPSEGAKPLAITEPAEEHKALMVEIPAAANGEKSMMPVELVIEGHGKL